MVSFTMLKLFSMLFKKEKTCPCPLVKIPKFLTGKTKQNKKIINSPGQTQKSKKKPLKNIFATNLFFCF